MTTIAAHWALQQLTGKFCLENDSSEPAEADTVFFDMLQTLGQESVQ